MPVPRAGRDGAPHDRHFTAGLDRRAREKKTDEVADRLDGRWAKFDLWDAMPLGERRTAVEMYMAGIVAHSPKRLAPGCYSSRVEIAWPDPKELEFRAVVEP